LSGAGPAVQAARGEIGGERVPPELAQQWWEGLQQYTHPAFSQPLVWRVSVPATASLLPLPLEPLIDWGGALRWYAGDLPDIDVRALVVGVGGTALRWRGAGRGSRFHPLPPPLAEIHKRLKHSFDPQGIFNPGRLLAGL
jgi:glycolate oxidase FAD binding subunit